MSQSHQPSRAGTRAGLRPAVRLGLAAALALGSAAVLLARALDLARETAALLGAGAAPGRVVALTPVEHLVEAGAVLLGLVVAAWLALGLTTATACAAARLVGRRWRLGERIVARVAPAVVRRAVALSAGTGLAIAGAGIPASADVGAPPADLGWAPTVTAEPWSVPPTAGTPASGGAPSEIIADETPEATRTPVPTQAAPTAQAGAIASGGEGAATVTTASPAGPPDPTPHGPPEATGDASANDPPDDTRPGGLTVGADHAAAALEAPPTGAVVPLVAQPAGAASTTTTTTTPTPASSTPSTPTSPTTPTTPTSPTTPTVVTVRPGDTLWGIASDFLPATAAAQQVADAWPRWYAANREVIGADPGLIRPGQRLVSPTAGDSDPTTAAPAAPADGAGS